MNRTRAVIVIVVAAALAAALWWILGRDEDAGVALEASGTVEATEADLGFEIPGRLVRVDPAEGTAVQATDTLAALDPDALRAALDAAEAQAAAARARLQELRSGARPQEIASARAALAAATQRQEEARQELERAQRLHEGGAISKQTLDRAVTAAESAAAAREQAAQALGLALEGPRQETIQAQEALVRQAEATTARARATLAQTVLTAPRDGLVTVRHREPGETVQPGAPVLTLMYPGDRWVRIYVREDRVGRVSLGQEAEIRIDAYPDRVYRGRVTFIGSEAEFTPRNVQTPDERTQLVYPVKVQVVDDAALELKPGLPADVRLRESEREGT